MDVQQLGSRLAAGPSGICKRGGQGHLRGRAAQRRHGRDSQTALPPQQLRAARALHGHPLRGAGLAAAGARGYFKVRQQPAHLHATPAQGRVGQLAHAASDSIYSQTQKLVHLYI